MNFPYFDDGDVMITLPSSKQYKLHSRILCMYSETFARLLQNTNKIYPKSKTYQGVVRARWLLALILPALNEFNRVGSLKSMTLDEARRQRLAASYDVLFSDEALATDTYEFWDNALRIMYQEEPVLPNVTQDQNASLHYAIGGLADVAEYLGLDPIIAKAIDNVLLRYGQGLWKIIASDCIAWAHTGYRIQSELLFREATTHIIGQWSLKKAEARKMLDSNAFKVLEGKASGLDQAKRATESRLMGHYPRDLRKNNDKSFNVGPGGHTLRGSGESTSIHMYQHDIYGWMALSLWRHWFGQAVCNSETHNAADGGYAIYTALYAGGNSYIDQEHINRFCATFPLSAKSRAKFDAELSKIKEDAKVYVKTFLESKCMLDTNAYKIAYLTCTVVESEELPWMSDETICGSSPSSLRDREVPEADVNGSKRLRQD